MPNNLSEIKSVIEKNNYSLENIIQDILKKFNFKTIISQASFQKEQGYTPSEIIIVMLLMPLLLLNSVRGLFESKYSKLAEMKKDTIYRLKNNPKVPWRKILLSVAKMFKKLADKTDNDPNNLRARNTNITAFILDDTIIAKTGRRIENISYVHDHTGKGNTYKLGFKALYLGYYDGTSMIPLDFTLQKEGKLSPKKRKEQYSKEVEKNTNGYKRRSECKKSKIENSIDMMKRAVKNGYSPYYVLVDSWFSSHDFIKEIRSMNEGKTHFVGGIKKDSRKYRFEDKDLNAKEILNTLKKQCKAKRNRQKGIRYYEVTVTYGDIGEVKLFFCRFAYQKEWRVFIATNITLDMSKFLEVYAIRWCIEVMFKEMKQYLGLGKCQSQDFDAHITQATISSLLFIFLSYLKRKQDYETIGGIFDYLNEELKEKTLAEKIWNMFDELLDVVINEFSKKEYMDISKFKESYEYKFLKEIFEASFMGNQLKSAS